MKQFIEQNAQRVRGGKGHAEGAGELDLTPMLSATPPGAPAPFVPGAKNGKKAAFFGQPPYPSSTGTGSLEAARGTDHLTQNGVTLSGEIDIFGQPFDATATAVAEASGTSWSGGIWNGNTWSGNTYSLGNTWRLGEHVVWQYVVWQYVEREHVEWQHLRVATPGVATPGQGTRGVVPGWASSKWDS